MAKQEHLIAELERRSRLQFAGFVALVAVCLLGVAAYFAYDRMVLVPRREAAAARATDASREAAARTRATSIAVLPLAVEGDQGESWLGDGVSRDLVDLLSRQPGLRVVSPDSAFQFRDAGGASRAIGLKLDAAHLLQGHVARQGGQLRLEASLVRVSDGNIIWSEHYLRPYDALFAVEDELAAAVGKALGMGKAPPVAGQGRRPRGHPIAAHEAVLRGDELFGQRDIFSARNAVDAYAEATRIDPRHAYAQARLAQARIELVSRFPPDRAEARALGEQARMEAAAALKLDPASAEAHRAQAAWLGSIALDPAGALRETERALALAPRDASLLNALAIQQTALGRLHEAVENHRRALALDPLSVMARYNLGAVYLRLADYAEAEHVLREALELQPDISVVRAFLALAVFQQNRTDEAIRIAQSEPDRLWKAYALAMAYWANGDRARSDAELKVLVREHAQEAGTQIAGIYAQRDDEGSMFEWLAKARKAGDPGIVEIRYMPFISRYSEDPRFIALARDLAIMPDAAADAGKPPAGPPGQASR